MSSFRRFDRNGLRGALERDFVEGVTWPVPVAALAALVDMGMSDDTIAECFSVSAADPKGPTPAASTQSPVAAMPVAAVTAAARPTPSS